MVELKKATLEDFALFSDILHPLNKAEIEACSGMDAETCLAAFYDLSVESIMVTVGGRPVCLLGIIQGETNHIWLIFSRDVEKLPIRYFRKSRELVQTLLKTYGKIEGRIHVGNHFAVKWAEWMGFTVEEADPYGVNKEIFRRFYQGGV